MNNIKLEISYDGTKYLGWQRLNDTTKTIQGKIESVLSSYLNNEIKIHGSGRTDGGVHAYTQVANFHTNSDIDFENLSAYFFEYLPEDIIVNSSCLVDNSFHARYNAISKQYIYKIDNNKIHNVFTRKYNYYIPDKLNIKAMKQASKYLIGKQDFQSFTNDKTINKSFIRELTKIDFIEYDGYVDIVFEGTGFLYNMVRIITGTLIDIGLSKKQIDSIPYILSSKSRSLAGAMAPAKGLYLNKVIY